jgi:tetratricopeptide (TPR) repeat protein
MEAWRAVGQAKHALCHVAARNDAFRRAGEHARRIGDESSARQLHFMLGPGYVFGPAPVEEGLEWHEAAAREDSLQTALRGDWAMLEAMRGRIGSARAQLVEMHRVNEELGEGAANAFSGEVAWYVETRAGEPRLAAEALRRTCARLEQLGERGWLSTQTAELGHVLCECGEYAEAETWARKSAELGQRDDIITQMLWRQVQAKVRAHQGAFEEAEQLARQAVEYGEQTDMLVARGLTRLDLAEVLEAAGRGAEAAQELEEAHRLFEHKGDVVMADRARARLELFL